jgi:putative sugar O-methyltransferase
MDQRLGEMLREYSGNLSEDMTSTYWSILNRKNVAQLLESGYNNFKQTVSLNYFTWLVGTDDPQVKFLQNNLPAQSVLTAKERAASSKRHSYFTDKQSFLYNFITYMLWDFVKKNCGESLLERLEEPAEGNPPSILLDGKNISQDLANSVLEYHSIVSSMQNIEKMHTIMELGAGYGRTAFVFLNILPNIRYIIVDIPPALYISEKYLTSQFPERNVFKFRPFNSFTEVRDDFNKAQIVFLMPHQLNLLPDKTADIFLAIDCIHEMRPEQINRYFRIFEQHARYLYFKCWKKTIIPYENVAFTEKDYPVPSYWKKFFWRDCLVQTAFFEALFSIDKQ